MTNNIVMSTTFKKISKIFFWLSGIIILILIFIFVFIQTETFNKIALNFAVDKLNESFETNDSEIQIGSLDGNILTGLRINKGVIKVKKDTLLKFEHIDLKYDLWGLLDKQIRLDHLTINSPGINLRMLKDSTGNLIWNFSKLFSSPEESDTSSSAFDWDVDVNNFKIENGSFSSFNEFLDSDSLQNENSLQENTTSKPNTYNSYSSFNPENLNISDLNIDLNVKYYNDEKILNLKHFSFRSDSAFEVRDLVFNTSISKTDTVTQLNNLKLVTDRSDILIDKIKLNNFNPFDSTTFNEFGEKKFEADIDIKKLNFADLKYFLPEMNMLDSVIALSLSAEGKYENISLKELTLKLPDSYIALKGNIKNLDEPDSLYIDIISETIDLNTEDIKVIYNDPAFPDYSHLGKLNAEIQFTGTLDNFYSKFDIISSAGLADGFINLDLNAESYNGILNTTRFNPGKILKDNSLNGNINIFAKFSGTGFNLNSMSAEAEYSLNNTTFAGYNLTRSGGTLNLNRNVLNMNVNLSSSAGNVNVRGRANIANLDHPVYSFKGKVNDLDLSRISPEMEYSDLNFAFDIEGRGISLNDINGNFDFAFEQSAYGEETIPAIPLEIEIKNSDNFRSYNILSDAFVFHAEGDFNIESLTEVINKNISIASNSLKSKLSRDTSGINEPVTNYNFSNSENDNFRLEYYLNILDTAAAGKLMLPFDIFFNGNIKGIAVNNQANFELTSQVNINKFVYQDTAIILNDLHSDITLINEYTNLSLSDVSVNANGGKVSYGKTVFDSVKLNADLSGSIAEIKISGKQDSVADAYIQGKVDLKNEEIKSVFDSVNFRYQRITVENDKDWIILYKPDQEISFEQFNIKSNELKINLSGEYVLNGKSDLKLSGKDIPVREIYSLINSLDSAQDISKNPYPVKGNIDNIDIHFEGDPEDPVINLEIAAEDLLYAGVEEDIRMGIMKIKLDYNDEIIKAAINVSNDEEKGKLLISGDFPFRNFLRDTASVNSENTDFQNRNIDMNVDADNFEIKYFLKLIPSIPDISGKLNGDVDVSGTASAPDLKGEVSIDEGTAFFALTGMNYRYRLKTSTENSKLLINNLTLSSTDDEARHFDIFGNIDFKDMKINSIDLNTSGDMVFLDESVSYNELGVYGYFRGGSGTPPISIKGNLDKLDITGEFLITDATISSVPLGGSGYENKIDNFTYILISDTVETAKDSIILTQASDYYKINPFARYRYTVDNMETSAKDFLNLDVKVKTQKNMYVSIDFDNLTRDRLYGEISVDIDLKTDKDEYIARGEVNILKDSYYRFYKDFKLRDSKITFDGPIDNPVLDIQAVYEGTKTTEQFGSVTSIPVNVKLTIEGELDEPKINLKLIEDGTEISGDDSQADAITFLLFGKYKSELSTSERTAVASSIGTSIGSLYISSIVSQTVRSVLPFIKDAQFKYSEGSLNDTEVELTSELGDATITIGGKLLKEIRNFEFEIEYPLNDFLNLDLPETLLLQFYREEENNIVFGSSETTTNTGLKILYKIKY